jgi:hypothetical protein
LALTKYLPEKWRLAGERPALLIIFFAVTLAILGSGSYWMASGQTAKSLAPLAGTGPTGTAAPAASKGALVVAELFTSEGCASCPPADDLLSVLIQKQPVPGVTVIGMSEHVEYWNDGGWTDPFSSSTYGRRQNDYRVKAFPGAGLYTPQIIVDGRLARIGNDVSGVYGALLSAAKSPKAAVNVTATPSAGGGGLQVRVALNIPPDVTVGETADVVVAVTEDHLERDVSRGENHGQHLRHTAVVRALQVAGTVTPQTATQARTWSGSVTIPMMPEWKPGELRVVGFLQEQQSRHILGAGWTNVGTPAVNQTSVANHATLP